MRCKASTMWYEHCVDQSRLTSVKVRCTESVQPTDLAADILFLHVAGVVEDLDRNLRSVVLPACIFHERSCHFTTTRCNPNNFRAGHKMCRPRWLGKLEDGVAHGVSTFLVHRPSLEKLP